ncbi:MAG: DUF1738 domain-containing protein, partial [Synergistaceae bacterium]|nr:DUF1738 domain-containing protein [Synergistaceae bacterium]
MITESAKAHRKEMLDGLLGAMEQGTAPWQQPWVNREGPVNAVTGRHYNGVNMLNLSMRGAGMGEGHDPRWCTFQQAKEQGWNIKKGSKGTHVEFYKFEEKPKMNVVVRNYVVFHASQIEGIPPYEPKVLSAEEQAEKAERILRESGAKIEHGPDYPAGYSVANDTISMPPMESFSNTSDYYASAMKQLVSWTGHGDRMGRPQPDPATLTRPQLERVSAREALVMGIGAMLLSAETGIP